MTQSQAAGLSFGRTGLLPVACSGGQTGMSVRNTEIFHMSFVISHFAIVGIHHAWRTMTNEN
jgi:hypothetical protein